MPYKYNPISGNFDYYEAGSTNALGDYNIASVNNKHCFNSVNSSNAGAGTTASAIDQLLTYAIEVKKQVTIVDLNIRISTGTVGNSVFGLYTNEDGAPKDLIFQTTAFNNNVVGVATYTLPAPIVLNAGIYWVTYNMSSIMNMHLNPQNCFVAVYGDNLSFTLNKSLVARNYTYTGTLPAVWGTPTLFYGNPTLPYVSFTIQ